ncbi:methenyltetrahydromethanopterin cyclohydrolase [Candidatus Bathyarchaeota archaeon]|nr:methenyltetrahydromethanopterin cyclohydrolase [Candidatus Bathyarchaeota archaeon]
MLIVQEMLTRDDELGIKAYRSPCGATVIDCGINVRGSVDAGIYVARITAGGLADVYIQTIDYGEFALPCVHVSSSHPILATLGGQLGDWEVRDGEYFAIGSGPARALALDREIPRPVDAKRENYRRMGFITYTPREIFEKIGHIEVCDEAIISLETSELPPDKTLRMIAEECGIEPAKLYAFVAPTSSIVGSVQIASRVVEVGIHKLALLGFDFTKIFFGSGYAPIAPVHPDLAEAMGRTNDAIRYGGVTYYKTDYLDDEQLEEFVAKVPPRDGRSFAEIFREAAQGFYDVDLSAFAPAVITVSNIKTGNSFTAGRVNKELLKVLVGISNIK